MGLLYNDLRLKKGLNVMSKKKIKIKFVMLSVVMVIGLILSFARFDIPFTDYTYNGFANSIKLGLDLKGGVVAVYEATTPEGESGANYDQSLTATIQRIQDLIVSKGFTEASVTRQGVDRIRVEVPDVSDPKEVFEMIGQPALLELKKIDTVEAEAILTGKNIKSVRSDFMNNQYGVVVDFDDAGAVIFRDLTAELAASSGSIYIYIGGTRFSGATVNETIANGSTFITGGMDQAGAEAYALKILSGTFNLDLELLENNLVSATLGENVLTYALIAGAIALALIMLFMYLVYGHFGLIANMVLVLYTVILLFFLQAIPLVQLTLPGIAGIILGLGMAVDANVIIFERVKDEYRLGKKIPPSVATGFKRAFVAILDSNVTTIIAAVVLYLIGTGPIKGFAVTLFLGIIVSLFCSLIVTRKLVNWYLVLNSTKPAKLKLTREETVNELK